MCGPWAGKRWRTLARSRPCEDGVPGWRAVARWGGAQGGSGMDTTVAGREPEAPPEVEVPGYRILRLLGEGGMGRVYLAEQRQPARQVALKLMRGLHRDARLRFQREAELLAALEHPGIARLYATGQVVVGSLALPWLALEFVD